jgi:hypothetical protein
MLAADNMQFDAKGNQLQGDGSFFYYFHSARVLPKNEWIEAKTLIGPLGLKLIMTMLVSLRLVLVSTMVVPME